MPVLFRVHLEVQGPARLLGLGGEAVHGLVFGALLREDPHQAREIHRAPHKPFALGPPEGDLEHRDGDTWLSEGACISFPLAFLDDGLVGPVAEGMARGDLLLGQAPVRLKGWDLIAHTTFKDLLQEVPPPVAEVHFLTPTVFRRGQGYIPLPDPSLLVHSCLIRWNTWAEEDLALGPEDLTLRLGRFSVHSMLVRFHKFSVVGFSGRVCFALPGAPEARRAVWALLRFATYTGVGHRTALGLGRVRVEPLER